MLAPPQVAMAAPATPAAGPVSAIRRCPEGTSGDIVVCGRSDHGSYRLHPLPPKPADPPFLTRPHVLHIGKTLVGLLGNGKGVGLTVPF